MISNAYSSPIPKIKTTYNWIKSDGYIGKSFNEIIPTNSVTLIALTKSSGKGAPMTTEFKPNWDSDKLFNNLFTSSRKSIQWRSDAYESCLAEYTIISDDRIFIVEIYGSIIRNQTITGIGLRGDGFGCWFNITKEEIRTTINPEHGQAPASGAQIIFAENRAGSPVQKG